VFTEYAKAGEEDILIKITVYNRGPEPAPLHVLPQLWFRNTWSWGYDAYRPVLFADASPAGIRVEHRDLGNYTLYAEGRPGLLFCENDTNARRLYGADGGPGYYKDGINDYLVHGDREAVNPSQRGTKAAVHYALSVPAGESVALRLRLVKGQNPAPFAGFDRLVAARQADADAFYADIQAELEEEDARRVQRQAFAGMLWSKQYYYFDVQQWLEGDPGQPRPPKAAKPAATMPGFTSTIPKSFPCPTSGNTPGTPPGTWRSTACRWRW
jgi:hypothetical protein